MWHYMTPLKYISAFVCSQDAYTMFFSNVYKNDLNVIIELWLNPGLV